ncbi:hypothetical protein H9P43_008080 [Blastocladiella emersonii ATCC 22665]|nr:hypothetical protein H9P43_008080 [Blastocladiella emersonii ATCC 22665]
MSPLTRLATGASFVLAFLATGVIQSALAAPTPSSDEPLTQLAADDPPNNAPSSVVIFAVMLVLASIWLCCWIGKQGGCNLSRLERDLNAKPANGKAAVTRASSDTVYLPTVAVGDQGDAKSAPATSRETDGDGDSDEASFDSLAAQLAVYLSPTSPTAAADHAKDRVPEAAAPEPTGEPALEAVYLPPRDEDGSDDLRARRERYSALFSAAKAAAAVKTVTTPALEQPSLGEAADSQAQRA